MSLFKISWSSLMRLRPVVCEQLISVRAITVDTKIQTTDHILNEVVETNIKCDAQQWTHIRDELLQKNRNINEQNVDSLIVNQCCDYAKPHLALDYIEYLLKSNKNLNLSTTGKYFKLLHNSKKYVTDYDIKNIYKFYDEIKSKYSVLDSLTAEYCLLALSMTERWRECIELIDTIELTGRARSVAYSTVVAAAFNNNEEKLGWEYLNKMVPRLFPNLDAYTAYSNYCQRKCKNRKQLEESINQIFHFWRDNSIYPTEIVIQIYRNLLEGPKLSMLVRPVDITNAGYCSGCGHQLPPFRISPEDFEHFSEFFFNRTLVGNDLYLKTTPTEITTFKKYIESTKPYDIVIDGLNAAYGTYGIDVKNRRTQARKLREMITFFVQQKKTILLLGRKHMHGWPNDEMDYVRRHTYMFLANNLSDDDLFLIYATLSSGINTYFVSRDLMRQHKFLLDDPRIKQIFIHWQLTRQILPQYIGTSFEKRVKLVYPPSYVPIAHQDPEGWHIPYDIGTSFSQDVSFQERVKSWICIRKPRVTSKKNANK